VAAAVRLMSLDPFATHAALARLGPELDRLRDRAVEHAAGPAEEMPCAATPLLDIGAERHVLQERRLFAS
jgi:urease accessory protein